MTAGSKNARIAWLHKYAARRKKFDLWQEDSDRKRLLRETRAYQSLPLCFALGLVTGAYRGCFSSSAGLMVGWVYPLSVIGCVLYLIYAALRNRWAMRIFDELGIENAADIPVNREVQA